MKNRSGGGYVRRRNAFDDLGGLLGYFYNTVHTESTRFYAEGGVIGKPLPISTIAEFELTGGKTNFRDPITIATPGHCDLIFMPIVEIPYQINTCSIGTIESKLSPFAIDIHHFSNPLENPDLCDTTMNRN
jgi:hypothetical protein